MIMLGHVKYLQLIKNSWLKEEVPAKFLLVKEGTLTKKLFYIETGLCRCMFYSDDGKEITMNFGFEGNFVSSLETINLNEPSWYSVETLEPTVVYSMLLSDFKKKKETDRDFELSYWEYIEKRLLHYQKLFVSRIKDSPEKRYKELRSQSPEIILRVPQRYIASFLGITSVSLSRIRHRG